jgi:L-amino acid N-acyltransferase YncA
MRPLHARMALTVCHPQVCLIALAAASCLLGGCSSEMLYATGRNAQRAECMKQNDAGQRERIDTITHRFPWLVCEREGQVLGYAYASLWKQRAAYRHSAELTVYVRDGHTGQGLGQALYTALIEALRQQGDCHVLLGCIALPNAASVALHERLGFVQAGRFREVGRKFDQWLDVGYWCLHLPQPA